MLMFALTDAHPLPAHKTNYIEHTMYKCYKAKKKYGIHIT